MKNQIFYVTKEEVEALKERLATATDTHIMELDGKDIQTEEEYVKEMGVQLQVPYDISNRLELGWYHDDITSCTWIKERHMVLIIRNFDFMLKNYPKVKQDIIDEFNEVTLPWWEKDVITCLWADPKEFLVYLEVEK